MIPNAPVQRAGSAAVRLLQPIVGQGLPPELVLIVQVGEVLPTVNNPAVLELEGDATVGIQLLAVALCGVVM